MRAKTLLKMAENLNAELIRRGDNLLEMWKKEVEENCDRIRENQTLKTERDQLLAKVDQLENDDLPRCKDALRRANAIGVEMDEKNQQLQKENEELKKGVQYMREMLNQLPAVEVVRCGECVHFEEDPNEEDGAFWCEYSGAGKMTRCDYCSKGIRKREDDG